MKLSKINNLLASILLCLYSCNSINNSSKLQNYAIKELNQNIYKLPSPTPLDYKDDIFKKITIPDSVAIVGFGEATHGTKEFFELKHRFFKYLVENKNYKAIAYEFSFKKSLKINDYICNGIGDIDSIFSKFYWIQANKEILNLIEWMRKWNEGKRNSEKIQFIGIDSQIDMFNLKDIKKYFKLYDIDLYNFCKIEIEELLKYQGVNYKKMTPILHDSINVSIKDLKLKMKNYKKTDIVKFKIFVHLVDMVSKSNLFLFNYYFNNINLRDRHLSENVIWVKNFLGESATFLLWTHNAHIANNLLYNADDAGSMGKHLKEKLGEKYLIIGTTFSNGQFIAVTADSLGKDTPPIVCKIEKQPPKNSVNYLLKQAKYKNFVIDFRNFNNSHLINYLDSIRPFIDVGDFYSGNSNDHYTKKFDAFTNVIQSYDIIFYFDRTTPIHLINTKGKKDYE